MTTADLCPYLLVVLVGFLPSEIWRLLAVVLARGLDEQSEILVFVRAVATTLMAAVVAKLLLQPSGDLAVVPLAARFGAIVAGLAVFFAVRRSVMAGLAAAQVVLITTTWWVTA